jgi:predicted lipid-binding transport protein (Tim44 family)
MREARRPSDCHPSFRVLAGSLDILFLFLFATCHLSSHIDGAFGRNSSVHQDLLMSFRSKTFILMLAALFSLGVAGEAFARAGGGFSMGSRGGRTFSAPPMTSRVPFRAAPIQRSATPNQGFFRQNNGMRSPGLFGNSFGRGLFGGLLGGFLGAGLLGMLFGHGLFGGLGSGSSIIGLLIQIGLLILVVRFALNYFRNRQQPAMFGGPQGGSQDSAYVGAGPQPGGFGGMGGFGGFGGAGGDAPVQIEAQDYTVFEQRLGEVQSAFSDGDADRLHRFATPEMVGYFREELDGNARRGVVNRISGTRLVKGDLAEAWREGGAEYVSVAMRFSLIDTMVDKASGRIVSGNPNQPEEVTELWTFVRAAGSGADAWMLSAIQQA